MQRGKKYIKLNNGDRVTASGKVPFLNTLPSQFKIIHSKDLRCSAVFTLFVHFFLSVQVKTESGAKSKAIKTGIYKKWKERSHKKVSLKGTGDEGNAGETTSMPGNDLKLEVPFVLSINALLDELYLVRCYTLLSPLFALNIFYDESWLSACAISKLIVGWNLKFMEKLFICRRSSSTRE